MSIIVKISIFHDNFLCLIGLSIRMKRNVSMLRATINAGESHFGQASGKLSILDAGATWPSANAQFPLPAIRLPLGALWNPAMISTNVPIPSGPGLTFHALPIFSTQTGASLDGQTGNSAVSFRPCVLKPVSTKGPSSAKVNVLAGSPIFISLCTSGLQGLSLGPIYAF